MKYSRKLVDDYNDYDLLMIFLTGYPEFYRAPLHCDEGIRLVLSQRPMSKYTTLFTQYTHGDITAEELYNLIKDDYTLFPKEFSTFNSECAVEDFIEIEEVK